MCSQLEEMGDLEKAIKTLGDIFDKYAKGEETIDLKDLECLVEHEMKNPQAKSSVATVGLPKILWEDSENKDEKLDIEEFSKLVKFMLKYYLCKKKGRGPCHGKQQRR